VELTLFRRLSGHLFQLSDIDAQLFVTKEITLNISLLFTVLPTGISTQAFVWFKVMCNSTIKVVSLSKRKYSETLLRKF
jgi:hypothetical protein